jgi:type II secretory pathway pseudopilin PulG
MTLLEVMVTLAIVAGMVSGATLGLRAVTRTDLRASAVKLSSSLRYLHDRARATAKNHRLVLDLDSGSYWAEETDDRFYLSKEPRSRLDEEEAAEAKAKAADKTPGGAVTDSVADSVAADDEVKAASEPWKPRRARFASFKDANLKVEKLKGIKITQVTTSMRGEAFSEGRVYVHFFPQGLAERAVIELQDPGGGVYSLLNHPLTGRVRTFAYKLDPRVALGSGEEEAAR